MVDDIKLALLGNQEAAKRLTDAGVVLMQEIAWNYCKTSRTVAWIWC